MIDMPWADKMREAARYCIEAAGDQSIPLLMIYVLPAGIAVEGNHGEFRYRKIVSFIDIHLSEHNVLMLAIGDVVTRLKAAQVPS